MTLTIDELQQVEEYIFARLPWVLDKDPSFVTLIEGIIAEKFPRRDEFTRALDELTALRLAHEEGVVEMRQGFEQVDQRLDHIDQRFEQVDQRFEQVDQRFEQVDQRFEQVDQRFEQVDQRFEQVDQRFEQVDQRFGQVDQRFDGIDRQLTTLNQNFKDLRDGVELTVGRLQVRSGRKLEDVVAGAMRISLKRPDIQPESILLRQKITDVEGRVFPRGRQKEIDIIAHDGEYMAFEVKSAAEPDDVDYFAEKVELLRILNPEKPVTSVFITLAAEPDVVQRCQELGIELAH